MSDMVIIDSDILIDAGRGVNEAVDCLKLIEQKSDIAISVVKQMELIIGCRNRDVLLSLELFLKRSQIFKKKDANSDKSVELLKQYRLSHEMLIADALRAATAIFYDECWIATI